ncbi:MAG TPA: glycoside hydrolase family 3 N-terminal domain-containing protein, partial [Gemmatimonadales bacterium]|nr:glycoside hydrolase family 3 N-terminal domain-containing protein [Gemmatimonadales bacterium]
MPQLSKRLALVALLALPGRAVAQSPLPPYRNPRLPVAERVQDLLSRMTIDEKFWQLFAVPGDLDDSSDDYSHGIFGLQIAPADTSGAPGAIAAAHAARIDSIQRYFVEHTRLHIPIIPLDEAVHGLKRPGATSFPQAIALAATWDTALVGDVAAAIASEVRSRGLRQVLSPVVNIASDVRWGRTEETFGEDPVLSSAMAGAFVGAMERAGVIATPKHFVANVGEGGRDSYPAEWSRRTLEERFFPPFRAAIAQGHAQAVMSAYNSVNGIPASQNRWLLTDVLRGDWGFDGFVISDQAATAGPTVLQHTEASTASATEHALEAGLDVIFQPSYRQYRPYLAAIKSGRIPQRVIDSAVARVLRAKFSLGLFDHPYADPAEAGRVNGSAEHRALARRAAREAIVLLRNRGGTLPLSSNVGSVALIGQDAIEARLGGYSGPGVHPVSIRDALQSRLGGAMRYSPGVSRIDTQYVTVPAAFHAEYFDNPRLEGAPGAVRTDSAIDFHWTITPPARGIDQDWYSVRWTGRIDVPAGDTVHQIGVVGDDGYRLYLDDSLIVNDWTKRSFGSHLAQVALLPGSSHTVRLEYFE